MQTNQKGEGMKRQDGGHSEEPLLSMSSRMAHASSGHSGAMVAEW